MFETFCTILSYNVTLSDCLLFLVSVGSAVGLFMGASILSIFELPYWLFVRRDRIA